MQPIGVCVKVTFLRPRYNNLQEWCAQDGNILVTRNGRVTIGKDHVYVYNGSPWANPYKLSQYTLEESLSKYEEYLNQLLLQKETLQNFLKLRFAKEIGCFCEPNSKCHRDVILRKLLSYL